MKKILGVGKKLNESINNPASSQPNSSHDSPKQLAKPTPVDFLRYRYHNGTNLGSIFVLEKWLFPKMFEKDAAGGSELDAVRASIAARGLEATRARWEAHWQGAVTSEDWKWLKEVVHCTTIRLPIGYFALGEQFCHGTPFSGDIAKVYTNAWSSVKKLVKTASSHGIGVLIDLHALPGGANADSHSGTSSKEAGLWASSTAREQATNCVLFFAQESLHDEAFGNALVGIEIVNEAKWKAPGMYEWYDSVLDAVDKVAPEIPIYVSDAWDLGAAVKWAQKRRGRNPVVIDTHKYFCFGGPNKDAHPRDIIERKVPELFHGVDISPRLGISVVVGEWSCVLGETHWAKVGKEEREPLTKRFGLAQSQKWYGETVGSFFWTWKMGWMPGGGWGYKKQTNDENIVTPPGLLLSANERSSRLAAAEVKKEQCRHDAEIQYREQHEGILKGKANTASYTQGWKDGYEDSTAFFENNGDIIGLLGAWISKRKHDGGQGKDWAEGFEAGARCFRELVGV